MKGYKVVRLREDLAAIIKAYAGEAHSHEYAVLDTVVEIGLTAKRLLPPKAEKERAA